MTFFLISFTLFYFHEYLLVNTLKHTGWLLESLPRNGGGDCGGKEATAVVVMVVVGVVWPLPRPSRNGTPPQQTAPRTLMHGALWTPPPLPAHSSIPFFHPASPWYLLSFPIAPLLFPFLLFLLIRSPLLSSPPLLPLRSVFKKIVQIFRFALSPFSSAPGITSAFSYPYSSILFNFKESARNLFSLFSFFLDPFIFSIIPRLSTLWLFFVTVFVFR